MNIALDVGTHLLRSLRQGRDQLIARRCRSVFALLDDHPAQRRLLNQLELPYAVCGDQLLLPGNSAAEFSGPFPLELRDLFSASAALPVEPVPRQILAMLIDALLPIAHRTDARRSEPVCCYSLSRGSSRQQTAETIDHLGQLARLRGYRPLFLSAGMALTLAEMANEKFTGIAIVAGAAGCEMTVAHCGRELVKGSLHRGGIWIDEQLARETGAGVLDPSGLKRLDREGQRRWKEGVAQSLLRPFTPNEKLLARLNRELIASLVDTLRNRLSETPAVLQLPQPLSVVCGGGLSLAPGFVEILRQELDRGDLPVTIDAVRAADHSACTIARGCLIHAELEAVSQNHVSEQRRAA